MAIFKFIITFYYHVDGHSFMGTCPPGPINVITSIIYTEFGDKRMCETQRTTGVGGWKDEGPSSLTYVCERAPLVEGCVSINLMDSLRVSSIAHVHLSLILTSLITFSYLRVIPYLFCVLIVSDALKKIIRKKNIWTFQEKNALVKWAYQLS